MSLESPRTLPSVFGLGFCLNFVSKRLCDVQSICQESRSVVVVGNPLIFQEIGNAFINGSVFVIPLYLS